MMLFIAFLFLSNSCGLISSLKDVTNTANQLLGSIDDIVRQVDAKVESGDLSREVGNLIDERLNNLATIIQETIQNSGGFLFDQANGTINNIFANISVLLDQIKKGILDDSLPALVNQISNALQAQINLLSASIEDIIVLTFGNTFILLDKTTNSVVIIASLVFLAIGLFVFGLVLFSRKNRTLNLARTLGLAFMIIYVAFFLIMILSIRMRGNIIAGFNFGSKYNGVEVAPKITSLFPESFVIGKNDKIYVYGKHLNLIKKLAVKLTTNNVVNFSFPDNTIIVKSANRIVLGNFGSSLNWKAPLYQELSNALSPQLRILTNSNTYINYSRNINDNYYEKVVPVRSGGSFEIHTAPVVRDISKPLAMEIIRSGTVKTMKYSEANQMRNKLAVTSFGTVNAQMLQVAIKDFFLRKFQLPEGDYGLAVYDSTYQVESPQLISLLNPPPPPPKPDIFPLGISWTGGLSAVNGQNVTADLLLGFAHPEQVTTPFTVRLISIPNVTTQSISVPMSAIAAAGSNNLATISTSQFKPTVAGNYIFTITTDYYNNIIESNEGNNSVQKSLLVKTYVYDVTVNYLSFVSTENMDNGDEDEYRIYCRTSVTNYNDWGFNFNKNGEPGETFSIGYSNTYNNLRPGNMILFYTSGHESDSGLRDGDDGMGEYSQAVYITDNITQGNNSAEFSFILNAQSYKISGKYNIVRRITNP